MMCATSYCFELCRLKSAMVQTVRVCIDIQKGILFQANSLKINKKISRGWLDQSKNCIQLSEANAVTAPFSVILVVLQYLYMHHQAPQKASVIQHVWPCLESWMDRFLWFLEKPMHLYYLRQQVNLKLPSDFFTKPHSTCCVLHILFETSMFYTSVLELSPRVGNINPARGTSSENGMLPCVPQILTHCFLAFRMQCSLIQLQWCVRQERNLCSHRCGTDEMTWMIVYKFYTSSVPWIVARR